jgi:hypothetical protein
MLTFGPRRRLPLMRWFRDPVQPWFAFSVKRAKAEIGKMTIQDVDAQECARTSPLRLVARDVSLLSG